MIIIKTKHYEEILKHSEEVIPNEACGLLGGRIEGSTKIVEKVYLLENIDNSPEHFSMKPKDQFNVIKDIRNNGYIMLGNFHSHPESPSRPSEEDKRLAFDKEMSYFILSLMETGNPILKSFIINKDLVIEEEIKII
ncbi:MAG TPA: M67 family metallopeptidase [Clostridiaceae bacterium]